MIEVVSGAAWVIFAPALWFCSRAAYATESTSPWAFGPVITTAGYFIVSFEPRLPSIHSTVASVSARARFVTRLYTFGDQFWIVVYRMRAPGFAISSTTAECSESVEYTGAQQPS